MNNLDLIRGTVLSPEKGSMHEKGLNDTDKEVMRQGEDKLRQAHNFLLDVEKSQAFYDEVLGKPQIHDTQEGGLYLPFDDCLFAFENPLLVRWRDGLGSDEYVKKELIGFLVYPLFSQESVEKGTKADTSERVEIWSRLYRSVLFFNEDASKIPNAPTGIKNVVGTQYITFSLAGIRGADIHTLQVQHINHFPCGNEFMCNVDAKGGSKYGDVKKGWVCDEIVVRDAFFEFMQKLTEKIADVQVQVVHKKSNSWWTEKTQGKILPSMPFGWPWTKGNLPKDNYVQYLDGKRYEYDKDEINIGSGIKHRYRYDVRRHPRIVNGHLVWIEPHQRGAGKYIPKVYANRKTWFVNYFWYQAEQFTKVRVIELLAIRLITLFRKFAI